MVNTAQSEIELLKASIQGNTDAFEVIVRKYQSLVCAITFSAIADVEKSEDMAQETFLHAWNNLSQIKDLHKFRAWLISITRNIINDSLRRQKRDLINKAASIDQIEDKNIRKSEPVHKTSIKEQQVVVRKALQEIPEKYREPLVLFYRQEKSIKHIAEQLELSEETVKQHLSRGRKLLREHVAAMVERTISRTGPTRTFTSAVMVSIIGMAVKSSGAAAGTAAAASTSSTTAGTSAVIGGITAKIVSAAAVVAIGIGAVVTYRHFNDPNQKSQIQAVAGAVNEIGTKTDLENIAPAESINIGEVAIQEPSQPENVSAVYASDSNPGNTINSSQGILSGDSASKTPAIMLKAKPNSSPYEYFLFTRVDGEQGQETERTLVLAHITDKAIEFKDIETDGFGSYRWDKPICATGGILYCINISELLGLDLTTKQRQLLSSRSSPATSGLINLSLPKVYADNRLYGFSQSDDMTTLRVLDFEKAAYRDITAIDNARLEKFIAVSADHKRLAYFTQDPNGYFLTIVNVDSGELTQPAEPIEFIIPMIASSPPGIPIVWLDLETVAFIRSEVPEGENMFSPDRSAVHMLSMANAITGQIEDITPLPGNPYAYFAPYLIQDNEGSGPCIQMRHGDLGDYRIDIKNRKLVEDNILRGDYSIGYGHLFCADIDLGPVNQTYTSMSRGYAERRYMRVSPDGKRIIWLRDKQLYYHDDAQEDGVYIAQAYLSIDVLWLKQENLRARPVDGSLSEGWTAFKDITPITKIQTRTETRKNIRDYLECTIKTDKQTYLLHEPIQVTLTLTNISNSDITIKKPLVVGSVYRPVSGLSLNYPGGQKSIYCGAQPYEPIEQEILLKAGESVSSTDSIEVNAAGNYSLDYKYELGIRTEYRSYITATPVVFEISEIVDNEKERRLFEAKFARLMDKFHREIGMAPNWNGNNNTVGDEITGMPGMGPKLAPYLIDVLKNETHENSRELLFRALRSVAGPECLPFFKERLSNGEAERACEWIYNLYRNSHGINDISEQALETLLVGMHHEDVDVRREVCKFLVLLYEPRIEACFKTTVEDADEEIRLKSARYLAAAEWLELADWLNLAASEPTYTRYNAAISIIGDLEKTWNITKGKLPPLTKVDFTKDSQKLEQYRTVIRAWQTWADENPRASFQFFEGYREQWWKNSPRREDDFSETD